MPTAYEYYSACLYAIERIAEGKTPTDACRQANLPYRVFARMCKEDTELAELRDEAEQVGHDVLADSLLNLDDPSSPYNSTDEKKQKILSDNIKWVLARRNQKRYGERIEVKQEVTIAHVITSQLEQARVRAQLAAAHTDVIDGDYVVLPPPPPTR